jgi:pimeloyl-ACP methyl ester carboxylesterase
MQKVSFLVDPTGTSAIRIMGLYWYGASDKGVILLHMMPETKESWILFGDALNKEDYSVLAIDLRGHGESTIYSYSHDAEKLDYKDFTDEGHQASIGDVEGAVRFMLSKGLEERNIYIGGASIGANLALQYLTVNPLIPGAFLLSPGLNYKGIEASRLMDMAGDSQRIFLIAAQDDKYSSESVYELGQIGNSFSRMKVYPEGGHGTKLLKSHPELKNELLAWLEGNEPGKKKPKNTHIPSHILG